MKGRSSSPTLMGMKMASGDNPDQATDVNMVLGHIRTIDPLIALSNSMDHELQHLLRWLHMPLASVWLPEGANPEDNTKVLGSSADCISLHRS